MPPCKDNNDRFGLRMPKPNPEPQPEPAYQPSGTSHCNYGTPVTGIVLARPRRCSITRSRRRRATPRLAGHPWLLQGIARVGAAATADGAAAVDVGEADGAGVANRGVVGTIAKVGALDGGIICLDDDDDKHILC